MPEHPSAAAQKAKRSLVKRLSGGPGFVGAGVSADASGNYELVVMVTEPTSAILRKIPSQWEGFPVRTQVGEAPRKFRTVR